MVRAFASTALILVAACAGASQERSIAHLTLVEDFRIGDSDTGNASFSGINGLRFDAGGQIWVLDRESPELRVFGHDGQFIRTIGRPGEGPGELVAANGFAFAPGGLVWVPDTRLRRYNLFDTTGRFIASHPDPINSYTYFWDGGVDRAGRLFDQISISVDTTERPALRRFRDTSLSQADTLEFPSCSTLEHRTFRLDAKNGYTIMRIPFDPYQIGAFDAFGDRWCSGGDAPSAIHLAWDGTDTLGQIMYERARFPVTTTVRDSAIAAITKMAREMGATLPDFSLIPALQPAVIDLKVDDGGRVWLRVPDTGTRFDLFDQSGSRLAEVVASFHLARFAPLAIRGDTLLAVVLDEDEVPTIVRMHLAPASN